MGKTLVLCILAGILSCSSGKAIRKTVVIPGAERTSEYIPLLSGKRVALVANQTSLIGHTHLADSLLALRLPLVRVFSPEHGFRGNSEAGQPIGSSIDSLTGLPVVSLYGDHNKPLATDLADIDIVLFDIQDVGVRFYTYISTLHYVMEACAENAIPLIVLDRPNPNGNFIDGPVLEKENASFVGMDPVPVVYGMTIGEYALMINGEGWLENGVKCSLKVIRCVNYDHLTTYEPPVPPSPNLPDFQSIRLYPSLAFFEGTRISVGRGTPFPFQIFGSPDLKEGNFNFTPRSIPGMSLHPKYEDKVCRGVDLRQYTPPTRQWNRLILTWLIEAYKNSGNKDGFFNAYFEKLSGTETLRQQIREGLSEEAIRQSWKPGLDRFKKIRAEIFPLSITIPFLPAALCNRLSLISPP